MARQAQAELAPVAIPTRRPLDVNREDEVPVGVQLGWALRAMIATGELAADERLPSVRELAERAEVNVNTVRSVYRDLEQGGLIVSRHGRGTFVAEGTDGSPQLRRIAEQAIAEARDAGVEPRDLARALYLAAMPAPAPREAEIPGTVSSTSSSPARQRRAAAGARRELRRQIGRLEAELAAYAKDLPRPEQHHPLLEPKAHVAGVPELERVRDGLLDQLADVRKRTARRAKRQQRAREHAEQMAREPEAHKWEWVSNEELGEPGCATQEVRPVYGPIGALMGWWRVKVSSGCP
jgi:DNA-binding transcriptional regulator YhcF (GntR family)